MLSKAFFRRRPLCLLIVALLLLGLVSPAMADAEYDAQWGLGMIKADEAYRLGLTGDGVTIGIVDTGIDPNHREFPHFRISGDNFIDPPPSLIDPDGHGSHVAGIIGAAKDGTGMHGVAYNSSLVSAAAIGNWDRPAPTYAVVNAMNYLLSLGGQERVSIINHSWGGDVAITDVTADDILSDPEAAAELEAFRQAVQSNRLMVFAAGNENNTEVSIQAGLPYLFPELRPGWLAVVALGPNGELPDYTNLAGVAKEWTITAPGGGDDEDQDGVYSVESGGSYIRYSGTSMAAPHVSGAAALVWEAFPSFTAAQVGQTLLTTADDLGNPGVDEVYGWGLLNVGSALAYGTFSGGNPDLTRNVNITDDNQDYNWSSNISGSGDIIKQGAGTLRLAGQNNYTGATVVEAGTLMINGSLLGTSNVLVQSGATLRGTGTIIAPTITVHGILAPGNSPGTLTVQDSIVTQEANSFYSPDLAGTNLGQYSQLNLLGANSSYIANGTLAPQLYGSYQPKVGDGYTIINSEGTVTGSYTTVNQSASLPGMQFDVLYGQDRINLYSTPNNYNSINNLGWKWNPNQAQVARIWEKDRPDSGARLGDSQQELYTTLFPLNAAGLQQAANQMSGQLIADSQAGALDQLRNLNHTLGKMVVDGETVKLFSNSMDVDSGTVSGRSLRSGGAVANYELGQKNDQRWGLGIGYTSGKVKSDSGPGSATVESYGLHYYTYQQPKDWYLQTQIGFGQTQQRHDREIGQTNVSGKTNGEHFFGRLAVGKETGQEKERYGLEAALLWESVKRKSMTETGNNTYTVSASSAHDQRLASEVALTGKHILQSKPGLTTTLDAKLGWIHDFKGLDNQVNLKWRGETMSIRSEKLGADAIQYGLGLNWQWEKGCQFQLSALGEHRSNSSRFNLEAAMNYHW